MQQASYSGIISRLTIKNILIKVLKHYNFQLNMINFLDAWECFVIIGDYGTGKTVLLDAATQKLVSQNVPVYFHCALDYEEGVKMSDDVLDIMLRYHNFIIFIMVLLMQCF